jgi:hypothetical protein
MMSRATKPQIQLMPPRFDQDPKLELKPCSKAWAHAVIEQQCSLSEDTMLKIVAGISVLRDDVLDWIELARRR